MELHIISIQSLTIGRQHDIGGQSDWSQELWYLLMDINELQMSQSL